MSQDGHMDCSYLGTDPSFYGIPNPDLSKVDYEKKKTDFRRYQALIRKYGTSAPGFLNESLFWFL